MSNPIMGIIGHMLRGGAVNPQAMIQGLMGNNQIAKNQIAKNVLEMAQKGDLAGIEQLGRNIAKEKGVDFDQEFANFKNQFPGM